MFRFGFLFRFLMALVLIGVLVAGGVALYRGAFAQGYQVGAAAVRSAAPAVPGTQVVPAPYYGYPPFAYGYGYGFRPFFPFGPLLGIGFFLLFIFFIGGLFRFGMRRHWAAGGYGGPGGMGFGHGPHSPQDWENMRKDWEEFRKTRAAKAPESGEVPPQS